VLLSGADGQLVNVAERENLTLIVDAERPLVPAIMIILLAHAGSVTSRVIDRLRERISDCEVQAVRHPLLSKKLERMVGRISIARVKLADAGILRVRPQRLRDGSPRPPQIAEPGEGLAEARSLRLG